MYYSFRNDDTQNINYKQYFCNGMLSFTILMIGFMAGYRSYKIPNDYCNITKFNEYET